MKKVLVLGGTHFIGRVLVQKLLEQGNYDLTLFTRGKTNPNLFPEAKRIVGDRETDDIQKITTQNWDCIIDLCAYYPNTLENLLTHIKGKVGRYLFVSTVSVFDHENDLTILKKEDAPILDCTPEQRTDKTGHTYGQRKAECERILLKSGIDTVILRPSLVYGDYDYTDRFYYWLYQVQNSQEILLPENGERPFSVTYVHDLANAIIKAVEVENHCKVYNLTTTPQTSIKQTVESASKVLQRQPRLTNASKAFLEKEKIAQWMDMPLWISGDHFTHDNELVKKDFGITFTDFHQSVVETTAFYEKLNWPTPKYGISENKRLDLLQKIKDAGI